MSDQRVSAEPRIVALDGLRGLMTIMVVASHYFTEVRHPLPGLNSGWIAVTMFFVLSGFLVGRLMLEKMDRANFLYVFFARRLCRTLPLFAFWIVLIGLALSVVGPVPWADADNPFPLWSYLTFTQNFFMVQTNSYGAHWLAPTWTLTVEEHFYLIAPAVFFLVPRRFLIPVLLAGCFFQLAFRGYVLSHPEIPSIAARVLLPGVCAPLCFGMIAACLWKTERIDWPRYTGLLRTLAFVTIAGALALLCFEGRNNGAFGLFNSFLVSIGAAAIILGIMRGLPESKFLASAFLCFFGRTSYSVYLSHLMVLGLVHGLLFGLKPDAETPAQLAASLAAFAITIGISWLATKYVEEPITALGRSFKWSTEKRGERYGGRAVPNAA